MALSFASQDSSRCRRPSGVGWIKSKLSGTDALITKNLFANEEVLLGRDLRRCQIVFNDPFISNKHLRIYSIIFDQNEADEIPPLVYAEDLSRNGTYWNGNLMGAGNGGFLLSKGDVLKLSKNTELEFSCSDEQADPLDLAQQKEAEKLFQKTYRITKRKIGSGGFGQVYMAINEFNHRQVACKIVPLTKIREKYGACEAAKYEFGPSGRPSPATKVNHKTELLKLLSLKKRTILAAELAEKLKTYEREVEILESLNHPNVIRLEKVFKTNDYIYLFQELVTGGDLFSFLEYKNGKLLDVEAAVIIRQIVIAVDYLHDQGIVHRDLKPDNILMTSLANGSRVVLTDFGSARRIDKNISRMTTTVGTKEFIAPEILGLNKTLANTAGYTKAVDMWSLGCVTIVLLTGGTIFIDPKKNEYCEKLASECNLDRLESDPDWQFVGKRPKDFVRRLMVLDENKRMTAKQALQHHWFTNDVNRKDFEDVYERGIKNWKSRMTIGPVVEDFVVTPEPSKLMPKLVSKKSKRIAGAPIEPPYKPFPRNFNSPFFPKKRSWNNLNDYIQSSRERSLDPDHIPDTDLDAIISEDNITTSRDRPPVGSLKISTPGKPNSTFQPLKRLFLKPPPFKPPVITEGDDCETPIETIENVFKAPSKPHASSKKGVLRQYNSEHSKQWPFSPGAWSKGLRSSSNSDLSLFRTVSREFTPINSKFHEPPPKRQKFVPLRPVTPLSRRTLSEDSPDPPEPTLWKDRAEASIANLKTRTPTLAMDMLNLKLVPSLANVKNKRAGDGTAFDFDRDEENEGTLVAALHPRSRKRKRRVSVFDILDDEEDKENGDGGSDHSNDEEEEEEKVENEVLDGVIMSTRGFSASFQTALDYGKQLEMSEMSCDTVDEKTTKGEDGIDIYPDMAVEEKRDDWEGVDNGDGEGNDTRVNDGGYDPDPGFDWEGCDVVGDVDIDRDEDVGTGRVGRGELRLLRCFPD